MSKLTVKDGVIRVGVTCNHITFMTPPPLHQPSDHDHDDQHHDHDYYDQHHVSPGGGGGGESVDRVVVVGGRVAAGGVAEYVRDHLSGASLDLCCVIIINNDGGTDQLGWLAVGCIGTRWKKVLVRTGLV